MGTHLVERNFMLVETGQIQALIVAPLGTQPDDLKKPEFWAAVQRRLVPWSRFNIRAEDGAWYIECIVIAVEAGVPIMRQLAGFVDEEALSEPDVLDGVRVEFVSERDGWRVIREADKYVLKDKIKEKREARRQRTLYLGSRAAA